MIPSVSQRRLRCVLSHLHTAAAPAAAASGPRASPTAAAADHGDPPAPQLLDPLTFKNGPPLKNRFMLGPLTNEQSGYLDGILSDDEYTWLTKRAEGGFGCTMTCAAHVQKIGQGFGGQLGTWSDDHIAGLTRLAAGIKQHNSVAVCQLHHAGNRAKPELLGGETPVSPSGVPMAGKNKTARAMSLQEVEQCIEDFILAAIRCDKAGFDGVELHGAHSYIICEFLSVEDNFRTDRYGGSRENRERFAREIIAGMRKRCRPGFSLGIRLSPENFGVKIGDQLQFVQELCDEGNLDYIDLSLWDCWKEPVEKEFKGHSLMWWFNQIKRGNTRIGAAGKIFSAEEAENVLEEGMDFVVIGRGAILHHDYPKLAVPGSDWEPILIPAPEEHLLREFLSPKFVAYMKRDFKGFVDGPGMEPRPRKSSYVSKRKKKSRR